MRVMNHCKYGFNRYVLKPRRGGEVAISPGDRQVLTSVDKARAKLGGWVDEGTHSGYELRRR